MRRPYTDRNREKEEKREDTLRTRVKAILEKLGRGDRQDSAGQRGYRSSPEQANAVDEQYACCRRGHAYCTQRCKVRYRARQKPGQLAKSTEQKMVRREIVLRATVGSPRPILKLRIRIQPSDLTIQRSLCDMKLPIRIQRSLCDDAIHHSDSDWFVGMDVGNRDRHSHQEKDAN